VHGEVAFSIVAICRMRSKKDRLTPKEKSSRSAEESRVAR
jgi:hypothetical protein